MGRPGFEQDHHAERTCRRPGADRIDALVAHSGMSRQELLDGLSQELPGVVDQLTPEGRVPTEQKAARLI